MQIPIASNTFLEGDCLLPENTRGCVLFAHGSGSSRKSPRNRYVADVLSSASIGTLLFDLLTAEEDANPHARFDIPLLAERLITATEHFRSHYPELTLGYFGASTGAASAMYAAARLKDQIKAIVSRGGRPDLAMEVLPQVQAPTLLIVGSLDPTVHELNNMTLEALRCSKRLSVVEGASHLFEEEGKLEEVATRAREWFTKYL